MKDSAVTNPGTIRTFTHKAQMRRRQKDPRFLKMKREHALVPGAICVHCEREHGEPRINKRTGDSMLTEKKGKVVVQLTSLTINHKTENSNLTDEKYLTWDDIEMEICCTVCNGYYRKGMKVCPVCKIVPIKATDTGMCNACYLALHPEIKKQVDANNEARAEGQRQYNKRVAEKNRKLKNRFPCKYRGVNQKCLYSVNTNKICDKNMRTAKDCKYFKLKLSYANNKKM